jgi:hypothetical protein
MSRAAAPLSDFARKGATAMQYSDYKCLRLGFDAGVAFASIDHPPINLLDEVLSQELDQLGKDLEADKSVRYEGELEMDFLSRLSTAR